MKQSRLIKVLAAGVACAVAIGTALAQERTTTTTTVDEDGVARTTTTKTTSIEGAGVISAYTPESDYITFRSEANVEPARYYYTKKTVLVDPEGHTLAWSALRPDMPVTYTYVKEGDRMIVTRVTVNKPVIVEKETTTTTTTTRP